MSDLSSIQCYDAVNKCAINEIRAQELSQNLKFNEKAKQQFKDKCDGTLVHCCNLDLVNHLYIPEDRGKDSVSFHVKKNAKGNYDMCPPSSYADCAKESDYALCASRRCKDMGYQEPDNYYQVCKTQGLPDCSDRTCDQVVNLIPRVGGSMGSKGSENVRMCISESELEEKGWTLGYLFKIFPKDEGFFIKATVIVGILLVLIMLFNFYLGPPKISDFADFSNFEFF